MFSLSACLPCAYLFPTHQSQGVSASHTFGCMEELADESEKKSKTISADELKRQTLRL